MRGGRPCGLEDRTRDRRTLASAPHGPPKIEPVLYNKKAADLDGAAFVAPGFRASKPDLLRDQASVSRRRRLRDVFLKSRNLSFAKQD